MSTSRRAFLKNSSLAIAGVSCLPEIFLKEKNPDVIVGIQLYTVRDDMERDPAGTLEKLAAMGYKYVEHAGYADGKFYGYSVPDFKRLLNNNGLKMESGHTWDSLQWNKETNDFTDVWKRTVEDAAAVGMKYLISPGVDESLCKKMDDFKYFIGLFNKTGELCRKSGIHFGFHNESYEFNHRLDGTLIYDLILQNTDKNLVMQQIDIGNMYEPGGRAMHYLKKYSDRFLMMHVKDVMKRKTPGPDGNVYKNTTLGNGVIPVKEIANYARKTGTQYFIIEQEDYQDKKPLECADIDLKKMKDWGFK